MVPVCTILEMPDAVDSYTCAFAYRMRTDYSAIGFNGANMLLGMPSQSILLAEGLCAVFEVAPHGVDKLRRRVTELSNKIDDYYDEILEDSEELDEDMYGIVMKLLNLAAFSMASINLEERAIPIKLGDEAIRPGGKIEPIDVQ